MGPSQQNVAGGQGFEPRQADPESAVLPLDDPPTSGRILTHSVRLVKIFQRASVSPQLRGAFDIPLTRGRAEGLTL
jgi:hypothetical protein